MKALVSKDFVLLCRRRRGYQGEEKKKKVNRLLAFSQAPNNTLLDNFGGLHLGEGAGASLVELFASFWCCPENNAFGLARAFRPTDAVPVLLAEFSGAVLNHVAALWKTAAAAFSAMY